MAVAEIETFHHWTREEYERMAAEGYFHPEARVELIEGIVYDMAPQGSFHSTAYRLAEEALRKVLTSGCDVRGQLPLALGESSEPQPDIAVVAGSPRDYTRGHPATALLVVEISDSSLLYDRQTKLPLYARHGIQECWIVNLRNDTVEIYREPSDGLYHSRIALHGGDVLSPLARPEAVIPVAELLP
jgi:Uma2 family endonuclease